MKILSLIPPAATITSWPASPNNTSRGVPAAKGNAHSCPRPSLDRSGSVEVNNIGKSDVQKDNTSQSNAHDVKTFNPELSVFHSITNPDEVEFHRLSDIVEWIRSSQFKSQTEEISRTYHEAGGGSNGKRACDHLKKRLPAVTLAGSFSRRSSDAIKECSGLVQIDIDGLSGEELGVARKELIACHWISILYASPSGHGIKAAARVDLESLKERGYRQAWQAITNWLISLGLKNDPATKDVARLSFRCHDADVFYNENPSRFDIGHWIPDVPAQSVGSPSSASVQKVLIGDIFVVRYPQYARQR